MSKLVRDNIPEIIEENTGNPPPIHIVSGDEFLQALDMKIDEEVTELRWASDVQSTAEEIADVIEVLLAIAKQKGFTPEQIEDIRLKKRAKRWGFEKGIILEKW